MHSASEGVDGGRCIAVWDFHHLFAKAAGEASDGLLLPTSEMLEVSGLLLSSVASCESGLELVRQFVPRVDRPWWSLQEQLECGPYKSG